MDLQAFDRQLRVVTPPDTRPFLCEGSPLDCRVFLVGLNPITGTPFWDYWNTTYGCRKEQWIADYLKRERKLSRTRAQMERLWKALKPVRCLETNLYTARSRRLAELPAEQRCTKVFDYLLDTIRPRMLFVHGRPGVSHMERRVGRELRLGELHRVELAGEEIWVYPRHHLSFQLSAAACEGIGRLLRQHAISLGL